MKQVIFFLAAAICFCSCNPPAGNVGGGAEQTKLKLLNQAGFDKMDNSYTYDYTVKNDSAVGFLNLVPSDNKISLTKDEISKGKLLNVFITADGHQYNTLLMRRGSSYITRVVSIDGNLIEEHEYMEPVLTGGTPPLGCENDCSESCMQNCIDYYRRSVFPRLQDSANKTCKTIYYRFMCPLGAQSCHADMLHVAVPEDCFCGIHPYHPGDIATRKMTRDLIIKDR